MAAGCIPEPTVTMRGMNAALGIAALVLAALLYCCAAIGVVVAFMVDLSIWTDVAVRFAAYFVPATILLCIGLSLLSQTDRRP